MHKNISISYILFNTTWENFLSCRGSIHSEYYQFRPIVLGSSDQSLSYLENSIRSFTLHNKLEDGQITLWIVELENNDFQQKLNIFLDQLCRKSSVPRGKVIVKKIPNEQIKFLLEMELGKSSAHKSPNKLHEYIIYNIINKTPNDYLYISDIDTLYLKSGFLDFCIQMLTTEETIASSFIQTNNKNEYEPDRMHTVSLFFDLKKVNAYFDMPSMLDKVTDFDANANSLKDIRDSNYFLQSRRCDTLSFFTSTLQNNFENNLLSSFNKSSNYYFEDALLVMGNEYIAHGKYFYNNVLDILKKRYAVDNTLFRSFQMTLNYI